MDPRNLKTFCEFLSPRSAEVADLQNQRDQAARSLEEQNRTNAAATKKKDTKPVKGLENALKRAERDFAQALQKHQKVIELSVPTWALIRILQEAGDTLWSPAEIEAWYKPTGRGEGPGEANLKARLGIESEATYKPGDLIWVVDGVRVIYREVKSIDVMVTSSHHDDREGCESIQTGSQGRHAFLRWLYALTNEAKATIPIDLQDHVAIGEITQKRLPRLPADIKRSLNLACPPSAIMGSYDGVYAVNRHGFIYVPREDCDQAWELESITKAGPKYILSDDYLRRRIRELYLS